MIPPDIVAQIHETAQVEEVLGDFLSLKKRGANYIACCPFHNEKTPSFTVSPAKNIYKCFGCGKAGNSVKFVMEHENMTYPESLRHIAKRYNIEIPEAIRNEEAEQAQKERDSLFIVNNFALSHFQYNLENTDEGRSVGLGYFKERGFSPETIEKFQLGYSLNDFETFVRAAKSKGFRLDLMEQLGLLRSKNERKYPFFRARVMFTIHNLSGKVIAFAGRTLSKDKKIPKYINSPETEIYNKSNVLYAMHLAKSPIRKLDQCFLVEGYTDVISMHQAGIENVVASSGTSLTEGQIRLIKRYTPNITLLFDGDTAGIKAALRGVDLVLEQGMNVKVVLLPDGEDPDSFVQKNGKAGFEKYIEDNIKDFIFFKINLLLEDANDDPIKRAGLIKDVINTISKIPDPIKRALYLRECSNLLEVSERILISESNKVKRRQLDKKVQAQEKQKSSTGKNLLYRQIEQEKAESIEKNQFQSGTEAQEGNLMQVLLLYGDKYLNAEEELLVAVHIITEINELPFQNTVYKSIVQIYTDHLTEGQLVDSDFFVSHADDTICKAAIDLITSPYEPSAKWEDHGIFITEMIQYFPELVEGCLNRYKLHRVGGMMREILEQLQGKITEDKQMELQQTYLQLLQLQRNLAEVLKIGLKY